jgi:multidrug efflux pump subunit AcrB
MWIVRIALSRPYTFVVLALLLFLVSPVMILRTPVDIFPAINVPVVSIIWTYTGLVPAEMENRITSIYERALTTTVDNIEHIESQSLNGVAVVKVYLQPNANVDGAIAEVIAEAQATLKQLPPGITPPLVIRYDASTVPILQLGLSGQGLSEQQLNDLGANFIRPQLATVPGAAVPIPYGGKVRQIMVDIDSQQLTAKGLSATDIVNAVNAQNVILPSGTAKINSTEYNVGLNGTPVTVKELNDLPVKSVNGAMDMPCRRTSCGRMGSGAFSSVFRRRVMPQLWPSSLACVLCFRGLRPRCLLHWLCDHYWISPSLYALHCKACCARA